MSGQFVIAQISDMHVRAGPNADGFDPAGDVERALQQIEALGADVIIATGDLVNDARAEEYAALAEALGGASAPLFLVPGNHDNRDRLRAAFPDHAYLPERGRLSYTVENFPVRIVALDQIVPGETGGDFSEDCARWLDETLRAAPFRPTMIALHHPPFLTGDRLLDTIGLKHFDRFAEIVKRSPQVGLVVCGHHHRPVLGRVAHAPAVIAPSTAWSFSLAFREGQPFARKEPASKGWCLHVWAPEKGFSTHFMAL
ncbi:MAG TPA: metallophosphoesterase [Caulobacterales bacterium]|nr:metallophosphoesterase [Caulobacterales bacterium]